jgi:hypothetical protein
MSNSQASTCHSGHGRITGAASSEILVNEIAEDISIYSGWIIAGQGYVKGQRIRGHYGTHFSAANRLTSSNSRQLHVEPQF